MISQSVRKAHCPGRVALGISQTRRPHQSHRREGKPPTLWMGGLSAGPCRPKKTSKHPATARSHKSNQGPPRTSAPPRKGHQRRRASACRGSHIRQRARAHVCMYRDIGRQAISNRPASYTNPDMPAGKQAASARPVGCTTPDRTSRGQATSKRHVNYTNPDRRPDE